MTNLARAKENRSRKDDADDNRPVQDGTKRSVRSTTAEHRGWLGGTVDQTSTRATTQRPAEQVAEVPTGSREHTLPERSIAARKSAAENQQ
jgi:hypothetical protein